MKITFWYNKVDLEVWYMFGLRSPKEVAVSNVLFFWLGKCLKIGQERVTLGFLQWLCLTLVKNSG